MVFCGDYEVEFKIYKVCDGKCSGELLGYMPGVSAEDAKIRWLEQAGHSWDEEHDTCAIYPEEDEA